MTLLLLAACSEQREPAPGCDDCGSGVHPRGILDPTKIGPDQDGYDINNPNSVNINHVDARFYLDLNGAIRIKTGSESGRGMFELYASINNVFDKGQPDQLRLIGNPLHFDPIGRYFKVGVRTNF